LIERQLPLLTVNLSPAADYSGEHLERLSVVFEQV